jgi:hypothetical protein
MLSVLGAIIATAQADTASVENEGTGGEEIRHGIGAGIILGEPTGLSVKKWISDTSAIDAAAAWSFDDFESFQLHIDYIRHNYDLIHTRKLAGRLAVFYGLGGRLKLRDHNRGTDTAGRDDDARLGLRIPFGLSYTLKQNPVEFFAEVVPLLDVVPEAKPGLGAGVGARYYFSLR